MSRPQFLRIPCGKVLGHGDSCVKDYLCDQCRYITDLEAQTELDKAEINAAFNNAEMFADRIAVLEAKLDAAEATRKEEIALLKLAYESRDITLHASWRTRYKALGEARKDEGTLESHIAMKNAGLL